MKKINLLTVIILAFLIAVTYACDNYELKDDTVKATGIEVTNATNGAITLGHRQKAMVEVQIQPENVTLKLATFESTDEAIFTINELGEITPKGIGTAELLVRTKDNSGVKTSIVVEVYEQPTMVESIVFTNVVNSVVGMIKGQKRFIETEVLPNNATVQKITFESSDAKVFIVSEEGEIEAIGEGAATLTAKATDGSDIYETCTVEVLDAPILVSEIILTDTEKSFMLGEEPYILKASVLPANATNPILSFTSSDPSVASIDQTGKITLLKGGTTTITVSSTDESGVSETCAVNVSSEYIMTNWTVTASSIENYEGGGPMSILDTSTDKTTFWVNKWRGGSAPLPHWLLIDMKEEVDITKFLFRRRSTGHPYAQDTKKIEISYSNSVADVNSPKDSEFTNAGVIDFGEVVPEASMEKEKELEFTAKARYIRMKITESNRGSEANVGYIKVFGK